jgi:anti-sigma B factor antagonist
LSSVGLSRQFSRRDAAVFMQSHEKEAPMSSSGLSIKEHEYDGHILIEINGEVDIFTCQQLKDTLYHVVDKFGKDLVMDCTMLNYIDSTGLGVFVAVLKKVKQINRNITIINLKESILKLFLITNLDSLFNIKHNANSTL